MKIFIFILILFFNTKQLYPQYSNIRVNAAQNINPEEVTIAISTSNPSILAAGANINYTYYSFDEGKNWMQRNASSIFGVAGDPCVLFDGIGNLYYAHLSYPMEEGIEGYWIDRIVVQKSTNSGISWNEGVGIGFNNPKNQDKEWMAVDLSNDKYKNNLYISWTEFDLYGSSNPLDSSRILFSRSVDHGESWSEPIKVSDRSGDCHDSDSTDEGAVPAVGPNGEIYLSWAGPNGIMFDKSTDGGLSFGKDIFVTDQPGGWDFEIPEISRCNGLPITACDTSHSLYRGNIYINWTDQRNGTANTDVFIIKSTDSGETWGNVIKVNNDKSDRQQFFTWMTIDQTTGYIYIDFYDRRNTDSSATDVYVARSKDGGDTFENFKVSESSFTPTSHIFFGDYTNIAAYNKNIYPIWMRLDGNALSIWTTQINDSTISGTNEKKMVIKDFSLYQNYPNPFNPTTTISWQSPISCWQTLKVYDVLGNEVATLVDGYKQAGKHEVNFNSIATHHYSSLPSGVYFYLFHAGNYIQTKKMLLLK